MASMSPIPTDPNDPRNAKYLATQGQALMPAPAPMPTQLSPEELELQRLQEQSDKMQLPDLQLGQAQIENVRGQRQALLEQKPQVDLSALYGLTDAWTGSNLAKSYNAPQTPESRQAFASKLQDQINAVQGGLTKDQQTYLGEKIKRQLELNSKKAERDLKEALAKKELLAKQEQYAIERANKEKDMAWQRQNKIEDDKRHADLMRELKAMGVEATKEAARSKASDFTKTLDKEAAQEFAQYEVKGGASTANKALNEMDNIIKTLEENPDITGPNAGYYSGKLGGLFGTKEKALKDSVDKLNQMNLRPILGSQFTAKEGEGVLTREFDPYQPVAENLRRAKAIQQQMREAASARKKAFDYLRQNKTLEGYQGDAMMDITTPIPTNPPGGSSNGGVGEGWTSSEDARLNELERARGK